MRPVIFLLHKRPVAHVFVEDCDLVPPIAICFRPDFCGMVLKHTILGNIDIFTQFTFHTTTERSLRHHMPDNLQWYLFFSTICIYSWKCQKQWTYNTYVQEWHVESVVVKSVWVYCSPQEQWWTSILLCAFMWIVRKFTQLSWSVNHMWRLKTKINILFNIIALWCWFYRAVRWEPCGMKKLHGRGYYLPFPCRK